MVRKDFWDTLNVLRKVGKDFWDALKMGWSREPLPPWVELSHLKSVGHYLDFWNTRWMETSRS
jgi:hypothetical protein